MNRNAWSPEERDEYDDLCHEAWDDDRSSAERVDEYLRLIRSAEQAHRFYASDVLADALRAGAGKQLKAWRARQSQGTVPVSFEGKVLTRRRVIGKTIVGDDGTPIHTQALFDLMTREELEAKAQEYATNIRSYKANLHTVLALLDLMDRAPGALNPSQAASQLGTTVEDFLLGEQEAS